jgi:hypothetical protein
MLNVSQLPDELMRMIFLYLQAPEAKMIRDQINLYNTDHSDYITKRTGYYLVKSVLSFKQYYYDKLLEPYEYQSTYETSYIHLNNRQLSILLD